ncbi:4Fe-4S ferredoxin, partial [candidate division KSB1 bacterium]|nr:4Fe-4S ferredoxin [candidate division KSB1 bacterium]
PTADAKRTVRMIVSGQFSKLFWGCAIVLGNVLPLLLILFGGAQLLAIAGVLVLAGIYIIEHIWVRAPQLISLS